tara:strand:- start:226 stop:480 length:255 start_codon:yes stop_codon:yes gene_type:complete
MTACDGSQYALAGSILLSVVATIGAVLKICASKGVYCECSGCGGRPCLCDTNEGRPARPEKKNNLTVEIPKEEAQVLEMVKNPP